MTEYKVSFVDAGPRYVKVRTYRTFNTFKEAVNCYKNKLEWEPKMEKSYVVTEEVNIDEIEQAF